MKENAPVEECGFSGCTVNVSRWLAELNLVEFYKHSDEEQPRSPIQVSSCPSDGISKPNQIVQCILNDRTVEHQCTRLKKWTRREKIHGETRADRKRKDTFRVGTAIREDELLGAVHLNNLHLIVVDVISFIDLSSKKQVLLAVTKENTYKLFSLSLTFSE